MTDMNVKHFALKSLWIPELLEQNSIMFFWVKNKLNTENQLHLIIEIKWDHLMLSISFQSSISKSSCPTICVKPLSL